MAGVAGALLAQTTQFVGIDMLGFPRSAELMIMLVLGGAGRLYGGLVGAAVFMIAQHYLSDLNPVYWQFWLGLLLVVVVLFARGGILGGARTRCGRRLCARAGHDRRAAHRRAARSGSAPSSRGERRHRSRSRRARGTR